MGGNNIDNDAMTRLVQVFRTSVNDRPGRRDDGPVLVRDTRMTEGRIRPSPPGL